jgi:cell volume regulation protein A
MSVHRRVVTLPPIDLLIFGAAVLLLLGVLASKASGKLGIPSLVLFLLIGMLAGSDGPGRIPFDDPWLAQLLGVVSLVLILFSGGVDTEWRQIRPLLWRGLSLATIGVFITATLVGLFAVWLLGFSLWEGVLLGAIVSSTDAAAVFSVLRTREVQLKKGLAPLLELESGSNDPMAVFLTIGILEVIQQPSTSPLDLLLFFARQMAIGGVVGLAAGFGLRWLIKHIHLRQEGLYPVLTIAAALFVYGATALLEGSGFLAVYLVGLCVGQGEFAQKENLLRFHDGLAWLLQLTMFLALGLLVFPSRLVPVAGVGLLVAGFLLLVARPISVLVALLFARMGLNEKLFVALVGLRGAAPIILTTFPLLAGLSVAGTMFNLVFFLVLVSVLVQGTSITWVARWLRVLQAPTPESLPATAAGSSPQQEATAE